MQGTPADHSPGGPRQLLRRLRDVMAGSASAQQRLDQVVTTIAADLHADVVLGLATLRQQWGN